MQAITTKFLPATNIKGSRIKATMPIRLRHTGTRC
jgi:hypothetical protein